MISFVHAQTNLAKASKPCTGSSKRKGAKVGGGSSVRADWQCICCPKLVGGKFKLGTFLFHELVLQLGCTIMTSAEREGGGGPDLPPPPICRQFDNQSRPALGTSVSKCEKSPKWTNCSISVRCRKWAEHQVVW